MNKFERKALEFIGEEEKERIAGGLKGSDELTEKQCRELREAVSRLSEEDQLAIVGGKKEKGSRKLKPSRKPINDSSLVKPFPITPPLVSYGGPGYFKGHNINDNPSNQ